MRVRSLVADDSVIAEAPAEAMVRAAGVVLSRLLREGETARDSALELLSADALATYALEAQSDDPDALDERCRWAMQHLSRIAGAE
jgi:hypothetical protein